MAIVIGHPQHAIYNPPSCTPFPLSLTQQNTMTSDTSDDIDVLIVQPGQISPGCPTAGAILDGHSGWQQHWSPAPTLPQRTNFAPIIPPTQTQNPWETLSPGSLILFQFDRRELATQLHIPEDLAPPVRKYVGLVVGAFNGNNCSGAQEYTIAFVSKILPPGSIQNPKHNLLAVPIVTVKGTENAREHPRLRARLFPWPGYYLYTALGARIVPTHINYSAIENKLDEEDFYDFDDFVMMGRVELAHQLPSITSSMSVEEALVFENMIADTATPLPVKVWQELTPEEESHDPREFVKESLRFMELAQAEVGELGRQ